MKHGLCDRCKSQACGGATIDTEEQCEDPIDTVYSNYDHSYIELCKKCMQALREFIRGN